MPTCGDGTCTAPLENPFTCDKDCKAPVCGDATCDAPWETALTCASDCGGGSGGGAINMTSCLTGKCSAESLGCATDFTGCFTASLCVGGCKDVNCVAACGAKLTGGAKAKFDPLQACIETKCVP